MNSRRLLIFLLTIFVSVTVVNSQDQEIQEKISLLKKALSKTKSEQKKVDLLNELSRFEMQEGACKMAVLHAHKAEKLAQKSHYTKGLTSAYVSLAAAYRDCGTDKKLFYYSEKGLKNLKINTNYSDEAFLYFQLGDYYSGKGEKEKSKEYLQKGITLSEKTDDLVLQANLHSFLANLYSQEAKYSDATQHFTKALALYKKSDKTSKIAWTAGNAGLLNYWQGNRVVALRHFNLSLEKYIESNNQEGIIWICGQLGNLYRSIKDFDKALAYFNRVLALNKKLGKKLEEGDSYLLLAGLYFEKKDIAKSNEILEKANRIFEEYNDTIGLHGVYGQLGANHFEQKKYDLALEALNKQIEISKKIDTYRKLIHAQKLVGAIYIETGRIKEGEELLNKTFDYFVANDEKQSLPFVYTYLVKADSIKGDYKSAFEHYKKLVEYRELTKETKGDTEKLAIRYEFEKKEAVAKAELKTKQIQRNVAMLGLVVTFLILIVVFFLFRLRNKKIKIEKENIALSKREVERIVETEQFKVRLLANISHEFRTPLTLINGHLEVLEENGSDKDQMHFQEMKSSSKHLLQLINQLLELSKMESTSYTLNYKTGFIVEETKALVEAFFSLAEQKNIQLRFQQETKQQDPFVFSQEALSIIVSNLLSNAFKFTPDGGTITVDVATKEEFFLLKITDSGTGIAAEHIPYIFDRFFQIDEPSNRTYEGSGIGLALVKELALLHGGKVSVESSIEQGGSTFYVQLKNARTEKQVVAQDTNTVFIQSVENQTYTSSQNKELPLVLVVEDQTELRRFIITNLGDEYRFAEAKNGKEGIQLAEELVPDLIISDIMMPDTSGLILCKTLKENIFTSHVPILLLTAKADQNDKITGLETGADDYLTKPFSLAELKLRVRNIVRTRQLLRQKFEGSTIPTPDELTELSSRDRELLAQINDSIQHHLSDPQFGVPELADQLYFSSSKLNRKMKSLTGTTPAEYIRNVRLQKAVELLKEGLNVTEAGWEVGFEDAVYFSKVFKKRFGHPPSRVNRVDSCAIK